MSINLIRSALAVALAATVLGMAGCGGATQAAGGPGGPPPAPSAALAGSDKPGSVTAPVQTGDATAATMAPTTATATATAQATAVAKPEAKAGGKSEAKPQTEPGSKPAGGAAAPVKPQATATASASTPAPAPARVPVPKSADVAPLKFAELYSGASIERGLEISDKTKALNGRRVRMTGYMAPPLKPSLDFFVLTKQPMSICPFCSTDADWPDDIILVLVKQKQEAATAATPIQVTGVLEVGGKQDPETGFYSVMRIYADKVEEVK